MYHVYTFVDELYLIVMQDIKLWKTNMMSQIEIRPIKVTEIQSRYSVRRPLLEHDTSSIHVKRLTYELAYSISNVAHENMHSTCECNFLHVTTL